MNVSVLIPCFNASRFILETLDSTIQNMEHGDDIVLVDDHSTDDSMAKAAAFLQQTGVNHQIKTNPGKGACAARNHALSLAKGHLIQWLDADDLLGAAKVATQRQHVHPGGKALVVSPFHSFVSKAANINENKKCDWVSLPQPSPADWLASGNMTVPACWLGNREVFEAAGPWDTSLQVNQDGEYFTRALAAAEELHVETQVRVYYRRGIPGSVSHFTAEKAPSLLQSIHSIHKTVLSVEDSPRMRQMIANRYQHAIYSAYPHCPEGIREVKKQLAGLPKPTIHNPQTISRTSRFFSFIIGWKAFVVIRQWSWGFRTQ
jgi:hypothetical protein